MNKRTPVSTVTKQVAWEFSDGHCWYCGEKLNPFGALQWDHVVPIFRGGDNNISNIVPACIECNQRKRQLSLEQWRVSVNPPMTFAYERSFFWMDNRLEKIDEYYKFREENHRWALEYQEWETFIATGVITREDDAFEAYQQYLYEAWAHQQDDQFTSLPAGWIEYGEEEAF